MVVWRVFHAKNVRRYNVGVCVIFRGVVSNRYCIDDCGLPPRHHGKTDQAAFDQFHRGGALPC